VASQFLFGLIVLTLIIGHALLLRSAWRLRAPSAPPPGVPRSDPHGDLLWTIGTAAATAALVAYIYFSTIIAAA
jgi:hypothetical protein